METSQSISQSQTNNKTCVRHYGSFSFLQSLLHVVALFGLSAPQKMTGNRTLKSSESENRESFSLILRLRQLLALIGQVVEAAILKAQVYIRTRKLNGRVMAGIFLVGCLAPIADVFYTWDWLEQFKVWNHQTKITGWYYDNFFYLFLCLGPYMDKIFTVVGMYLILVQAHTKRSWLTIIPVALAVARIILLMLADDDLDFHRGHTAVYVVIGLIISTTFWLIADYLAYRYNHKYLNHKSTMNNITNNRKHLPAEQVVEMYATTWSKMNESY